MRKKTVSLLLAMAITASVLAGCGQKENASDDGRTTEKNLSDETDVNGEAADMEEGADYYNETAESGEYDEMPESEEYDETPEYAEDEYADMVMGDQETAGTKAEKQSAESVTDLAGYNSPRYADEYRAPDVWEDSSSYNGEEYNDMDENPFYLTKKNPLSTFSADVDTASYTNIRRMLKEGYSVREIPSGAVRIEEMLNYFSYDLKRPKGNAPFAVTTEVGECPWNRDSKLLMVGISTREIDFSEAKPSNLVFLLDVSGSMADEDKLPLLQKSFSMLTDNLTSKDRVSIVTYASEVQVVLKSAKGNDTDRILSAINDLYAEGGTNGGDGIQTAYELAEANFIKGGNNRIILATDGDLNIGLTSERELEELIVKKKESGVFLSVLGFGTGNLKDNKMELLADRGNGNYSYIDSQREAKKVLVQEMGATLMTVAKDVKFQVEFNPEAVESYRLIGYENRVMNDFDFQDDTKDAGEIGAGHSMIALYEIIPTSLSSEGGKGSIKLKYQDGYVTNKAETNRIEKGGEYCTVKIRYKEPAGNKSKESAYPVKGDSYQRKPSEDFKFAACVAQLGMLLKNSEYVGDGSLRAVMDELSELDLRDEYRMEFYYLVRLALESR